MSWLRSLGPGLLVTAAFIGPGTVTTASVAGSKFGFALLWALVFSVFATVVLQEMAARLGLVTGKGLGEALRTTFDNSALRISAAFLVVASITLGNAAYQTGNLTGAAIGLEAITGTSRQAWVLLVGAVALAALGYGVYGFLERLLMVLVGAMSLVFLLTAMIVRPSVTQLLEGILRPSIPSGAIITVIALIGTTVVPYNLFLHASSVRQKWSRAVPLARALRESRLDTCVSIALGGLITLAVMATSAAAFFAQKIRIEDATKMAEQLEPLLGSAASYFFALGLLAAGLSSAITAPLAASYATAGVLDWATDLRDWKFRSVWALVIAAGTVFALLGKSPIEVILFAQAANGVLLPLIAIFLLVVMNRSDLLGEHKNGAMANVLGVVVILTATGLGIFQLLKVFGVIPPE